MHEQQVNSQYKPGCKLIKHTLLNAISTVCKIGAAFPMSHSMYKQGTVNQTNFCFQSTTHHMEGTSYKGVLYCN